jgi:hypothetical protein
MNNWLAIVKTNRDHASCAPSYASGGQIQLARASSFQKAFRSHGVISSRGRDLHVAFSFSELLKPDQRYYRVRLLIPSIFTPSG